MNYVGIDLHKKSISVCVVDQARKVLRREKFPCREEVILAFFQSLGPFQAVVEATASYQWLWKLLVPIAQRLVLAHPGKMRIIAESTRKSDKLDAQVLAEFLAMDLICPAHRPSDRQQELRRLVRHRIELVRDRGKLQTRIRWMVANYNLDRTSMFSLQGQAWLRSIEVCSADRFAINQLLDTWKHLTEQIRAVESELAEIERKSPAQEKEARRLLRSVPGIGTTIANVFLAEVGDVSRFSSSKKVAAYVGLAPARRESAGKSKELAITKQGSRWLRWAMIQAAWLAVRHSIYWRSVFEKLAQRKGSKKAIVAIARRLLVVMYRVLRTAQPYDIMRIQAPGRSPTTSKEKDHGRPATKISRGEQMPKMVVS